MMHDHTKKMKNALVTLALLLPLSVFSQQAEHAPADDHGMYTGSTKALFDIQFQYNVGDLIDPTASNRLHNGVAWTGTEFWLSRWNNDTLWTTDINGNLTATFVVAGVGQVRSITWDGAHLYMGAAGSEIFKVDPVTKTLVSTISLAGGNVGARMCAFDPTADGGNGGFWIGNFTSDIQLVSMTGSVLLTIAETTHNIVGIYGGAVDNMSAGGPYLWVYAQPGTPSDNVLFQLAIPSGIQTGVTHNVDDDVLSTSDPLAGGAFISDELVAGTSSLIVVTQDADNGSPLVAYELNGAIGIEEVQSVVSVSIQPNPASTEVLLSVVNINSASVQIVDAKGAVVLVDQLVQGMGTIDISTLEPGTYIVIVKDDKTTLRDRFVITR